ncbi:MAG: 2-isopropylmalate synthase [Rikenellaceae bacterium]
MSSKKIEIFDTTLRDGEQVPGCQLSAIEKLELAESLEELGVDILEVGFPVSSRGEFNAIREVSKVVKSPVLCVLSRAVPGDIEVAASSLRFARRGRIHTGIGVSPYHIEGKLRSSKEEVLQRAIEVVKLSRRYVGDVQFYAEDAGRADDDFLCTVVESVIRAGATVINIPDTTGYCMPEDFFEKISMLRNRVPNIDRVTLSVHCHNDLGLATANSLAGVRAGATQVECTVNGIGERAGNASLEEVVMAMRSHPEMGYHTSINTERIVPTSRLVAALTNMSVQNNKAIVGRNAFAHSSGIHQDGVLKCRESYEIIDPRDVGLTSSSIVLTARSGRAALRSKLMSLGYRLRGQELDMVYERFLLLAEGNKYFTEEDVLALVSDIAIIRESRRISLDTLEVVCGTVSARAEVGLYVDGEYRRGHSSGDGPIEASFSAVRRILGLEYLPGEFIIQPMSRGSYDMGRVNLTLDDGERIIYGFASSTDIVRAAVGAYIDALNKL